MAKPRGLLVSPSFFIILFFHFQKNKATLLHFSPLLTLTSPSSPCSSQSGIQTAPAARSHSSAIRRKELHQARKEREREREREQETKRNENGRETTIKCPWAQARSIVSSSDAPAIFQPLRGTQVRIDVAKSPTLLLSLSALHAFCCITQARSFPPPLPQPAAQSFRLPVPLPSRATTPELPSPSTLSRRFFVINNER